MLIAAAVVLLALGAAGFMFRDKIKAIVSGPHAVNTGTGTGTNTETKVVVPVDPPIDANKIHVAGELKLQVHPFVAWSYTPTLEGVAAALDEKYYKGWTTEYILKDPHPAGMEFKDKTLVWTPTPADFASLKNGESNPVSIAIRGVWKRPDGTSKELFAVGRPTFTLSCQFGYEAVAEQDLGLPSSEPLALASLDVDNDGQPDLFAAWGPIPARGTQAVHVPRRKFRRRPRRDYRKGALLSALVRQPGKRQGRLACRQLAEPGDVLAYFIEDNQPKDERQRELPDRARWR